MKILQQTKTYDYREFLNIFVDDKRVASFHDGEPEDNTLCRNFSDCYSIAELMERAYNAGKNGEELIIEYKKLSEDEWDED